jgi:hypothetical protein
MAARPAPQMPAATRMRAIVQDTYGEPEAVLGLQDIARPVAKDGDVLIRVHAASVHLGAWILLRGVPYRVRTAVGLRKPTFIVPGAYREQRDEDAGLHGPALA